jgi:tRNA A37 threonylcarbamoyladenosine synthetase subunit TsaC/SUA5/YrdC
MQTKDADLQFFLSLKNNQKVFYANTESSLIKLKLFTNMNQSSHTSVRLFEDKEALLKVVKYLPSHVQKLFDIFTPGPIHFKLQNYDQSSEQRSIIAYIPQGSKVQNLSQQFQNTLLAQYQNPVLALRSNEIVSVTNNKQPIILNSINTSENILPTLLDCRDGTKVILERPGSISAQDIQSVLPGKILFEKRYLKNNRLADLDIFLVDKLSEISSSSAVILGTKEKLAQNFKIKKHFNLQQFEGLTLINLGSQTNSENIIKHLSSNLLKAKKQGLVNIYLLNQKWPNNRWGEILTFVFKNIGLKLSNSDNSEQVSDLDLPTVGNFAMDLV